jgi:hypothetical protein
MAYIQERFLCYAPVTVMSVLARTLSVVLSCGVVFVAGCLESRRTNGLPGLDDGGLLDAVPAPDTRDAQVTPDAVIASDLKVFPRYGASADDAAAVSGPGLVLDGGFMGAPVLAWMRALLSSDLAGLRGDVVVLSPNDGDTGAGAWLTQFRSVQTLYLGAMAGAQDFSGAADIVNRAEVVFFTGGDQAKYIPWAGTAITRAVADLYARGGVVSGSSAGMIILGSSVNDATKTLSENLTTPLLLADPYDARVHFTQNIFHFPPLVRSITDPHFVARDRMGRLATFMARQVQDGFAAPDILGIGVDDGAALGIANGIGRRLAADGNKASSVHVVRGAIPAVASAQTPLRYEGLVCVRLETSADTFNFADRCGSGAITSFAVQGASVPPVPPYPASIYAGGVRGSSCP